jgi:hypothetical protein
MPIFNPCTIISINNELFITGYDGIFKTDLSLNLVASYTVNTLYTCVYYNHTSDTIYATSYYNHRIDLFDRNLSLISSISFTDRPYALTEKNGKLYVGLTDSTISVLENNLVVKTITTLCPGWITSIIIDTNELMAVLCLSNSMLYLYTTNGSYTGIKMATPNSPNYMNYDLNGHFIIVGGNQINLYY